MAEIIPLRGSCAACVAPAPPQSPLWRRLSLPHFPLSFVLSRRRKRVGNADDLPERLRRDMGLAPQAAEPGRHYADYLPSTRA